MLKTNQIISTQDLILVRHKELEIEHKYLCSKFIEQAYLPSRFSDLLKEYRLPQSLCFNPFYHAWIGKLRYLLTSNGFSADLNTINWNETFTFLDSPDYNRFSILIFLEFLALILLEDLESQNEKTYQVNTRINQQFYIPGYLILGKDISVDTIVVSSGAIYFDNAEIELNLLKKEVSLGSFVIPLHSNLKFQCKDLPSIIINDVDSIYFNSFLAALDLLDKFFLLDFDELNLFSKYFFPIYSNNDSFYSGNDDYHLGLIYLPNITNHVLIAECLIHELMHQKLNNVERIKEVILPCDPEKEGTYFSPWRDDPRPIRMVLHGLFVFTAIVEFWQNLIGSGVVEEKICKQNIELRIRQNLQAIEVLKAEASFDSIGELIFENLIAINSKHMS